MTWGVGGERRKPEGYVVCCKKCSRSIPAGVTSFPAQDITVPCPLCGDIRRYRRAEVFLGWADQMVSTARANELQHITQVRQRKPPKPIRRVLLTFVPNGIGYTVQLIADDCRTPISPMIPVRGTANTLTRLVRYAGGSEANLADLASSLTRWNQGSVWIDNLTADGARKLQLRIPLEA